jgi:rhodanese-related sulfurtransferase
MKYVIRQQHRIISGFFLVLISIYSTIKTYSSQEKGSITNISAEELKKILDNDDSIILINAMPPEVYKDCRIKAHGSINAPFYQKKSEWKKWEKLLLKKHPNAKKEPVYVYCASYTCSASEKACNTLRIMGFMKIFKYKGGSREWLEKYGKKYCIGKCEMEYLYQ